MTSLAIREILSGEEVEAEIMIIEITSIGIEEVLVQMITEDAMNITGVMIVCVMDTIVVIDLTDLMARLLFCIRAVEVEATTKQTPIALGTTEEVAEDMEALDLGGVSEARVLNLWFHN